MVAFARAQPRTFAVRVRRRDKSFPLTSQEIERQVGAAIQERTALPGRPLATRTSSCASSSTRTAPTCTCASSQGAGGLPVGTSGRAVALLSGGIDSPVASLLAMKRGLEVEFIHFSGEPYLDPTATVKARAQARVLNGFQAARPGRDVGGPVRAPAADALGGLAGVAPDRAVPPPDGAHRPARSRSACERLRS